MFKKKQKSAKEIMAKTGGAPKEKKSKKKIIITSLIVLLVLVLVGLVVFLGDQYYGMKQQVKAYSDPKYMEDLAKKETKELMEKVGKHMVLPTGEEPVLATITDINALKKEQPFYEGCNNGDKILIFKNAKVGIVYDPGKDIIVKTGPVYFDESKEAAEANTDSTTPKNEDTSSSVSGTSTTGTTSSDTTTSSSNNNLYNQYNSGQ